MKIIISFLFCLIINFLNAQTTVSGKVTDPHTGEELIGANIAFYKNGNIFTGTMTDFDGNYKLDIDAGTYDVVSSYIGLADKRIEGVVVKANQTTFLNIEMDSNGSIQLDEIVVTDYKVPLIAMDNTSSGAVISSSQISRSTRRRSSSSASKSASSTIGRKKTKAKEKIDAGQLTAGEWKDLDHWTFWKYLLKKKKFSENQKHWNYQTTNRFSIKLSDQKGRPASNLLINLLDSKEEMVWTARTDNHGSAELWGNFFGGNQSIFSLQIIYNDEVWYYPAIPYIDGVNSISLPIECTDTNRKIQVAFVMDATNSMLDEMAYLKAEIKDVIEQVKEGENVELESGAIYYTDRHHNEPIHVSALNTDESQTINFIKKIRNQSGGSDWPEAVHLGLDKGINELEWDKDALTRIIFLILDAPPHHEKEILANIQKNIALAAKKGIKIIPVAASGTDKKAEFLFKFFAMATNGTYTFLTDHSGIGNKHIAPEAKDYNIETLNDLLVRLILENSEHHECQSKSIREELVTNKNITKKTRRRKRDKTFFKTIKSFPNPADDHLFVETKQDLELLLVASADSKIIAQFPQLKTGQIKIKTSDWTEGVYYLNFYHEGKHIVKRAVVSH